MSSIPASVPPSIAQLMKDCGLARHEAWPLLEGASGLPREYWIAHDDQGLAPGAQALFARWVAARQRGVPVAYLTQSREFYGRNFWVNGHTLIPRIDTELLIDKALALINQRNVPAVSLCDLGTGSGCIAITLALELRRHDKTVAITATDASEAALRVARNNAAWLGVSEQVQFQAGSWWEALTNSPARFDGILSNPPYIAANDPHLQQGDLRFEPQLALTPGNHRGTPNMGSGLADIAAIVGSARGHLNAGGFVLIEHGHDQQEQVKTLFTQGGLVRVEGLRDSAGTPRAVLGFAP